MTERDYLTEYENDKPRMRNFILLVITVAVVMAAMIYINI